MKNFTLPYFLIISFFSLSSCSESGLSQGLSKEKAKEIIQALTKDVYGLCLPKQVEFTLEPPRGYGNMLVARKTGLITTKQVGAILGQLNSNFEKPYAGDIFSLTLTEKAISIPHLEDVQGRICFLTEHTKVDDIIDLLKNKNNQYTALFSYRMNYTEFGNEAVLAAKELNIRWTDENERFRGAATVDYDPFLKEYVLQNLLVSKWDKENWVPGKWITTENNKKTIRIGSGTQ